jgi:GH3 auxin-responsive promoter
MRLQIAQLRGLIRRAERTEFGQAHGFAKLAAATDSDLVRAYRENVRAADWYVYKDQIARMRENAEPDVLWPGLVKNFAQTSGTTAGDKFIPVSNAMLKSNYAAALDIFATCKGYGVPLSRLLSGKALFLGGTTELSVNQHGIRTGDLSGIVTPMIKWPISKIYAPGAKIALLSDWPSKIEAMAQECIEQDIRMINGMPSWAMVLFDRVIALARERGKNATTIRDVWPNLSVFVHGGVKYTPFEPRVRQFYSGSMTGADIPWRHELYPASEGFIAMQDTAHDPGLRLLSDIGNFYEFIPLEQIDDPEPPAFTADAVEKGQKYVVCMSTCAGLWRYIIGDVVVFDTVCDGLSRNGRASRGDGPSRMRIVGRHRHFINAFGENLIVEHIENAVAAAARATGVIVGEFTAAPVYPGPSTRAGLELAVEIESKPSAPRPTSAAIESFAHAFDASLKEQNVDYTTKRSAGVGMAGPIITPLAMGTFHAWMASRGKLGGQNKCPRCANHREYIDGVTGIQSARA